jgi:hypothetical protein
MAILACRVQSPRFTGIGAAATAGIGSGNHRHGWPTTATTIRAVTAEFCVVPNHSTPCVDNCRPSKDHRKKSSTMPKRVNHTRYVTHMHTHDESALDYVFAFVASTDRRRG